MTVIAKSDIHQANVIEQRDPVMKWVTRIALLLLFIAGCNWLDTVKVMFLINFYLLNLCSLGMYLSPNGMSSTLKRFTN